MKVFVCNKLDIYVFIFKSTVMTMVYNATVNNRKWC